MASEAVDWVERFTVHVPEAVLGDLRDRLARARVAPGLEPGWRTGTCPRFLAVG
jgi:hypothetical protein